jgi:hypothetical protein
MSSRHLASRDDDERGRAVDRLRAAVAERREAHTRSASEGTPANAEGSASSGPADDQRAAAERPAGAIEKQDS